MRANAPANSYDALTVVARRAAPLPKSPARRKEMKELTFEEVLRIAGGVPPAAALDELTYRAPEEARSDPIEATRLAVPALRAETE